MKEIMEVAKFIRKETDRADMYAYEAVKHKTEFPDMAQHYYNAAQAHLNIADDLHTGAARMIEMARRNGDAPTAVMLKVWEHEHEMMIDDRESVLRKMSMFKM